MAGDGPYFFHGGEVYKAPEFGVPELRLVIHTLRPLTPFTNMDYMDK